MAQYGRPDGDVSSTNFAGFSATTPGSLYTNIDESTASDSDYVYTTTSSASYECSLSDVTDPASSSGHVFRFRVSLSGPLGGGDDPLDYTVSLYQGATLIASSSGTIGVATVTAVSKTLSSGEADSITDYTNLRLRFTVPSATSPAVRFTWAELEVPDAPSDTVLSPSAADADAGANNPTPVPGQAVVSPGPAIALAYGGAAGAATTDGLVLVPDPPAVAYALPGEFAVDLLPTTLYPDPAAASSAGVGPGHSGAVTVAAPAAASQGATGAVSAPPDGGQNVTPSPALAYARIPSDLPAPDTGATKKRRAGCRCTCGGLLLKSITVTVRGCCSACLGGAKVQLLSGGVVVAEATVPFGSCSVILSTTAVSTPYQIRVSAPGFVTQTITVTFTGGSAPPLTVTLLPEPGRICLGPCGNTAVVESAAKTLVDAKGNAIAMTLFSPGVYRGSRTYAVEDGFIDPCELVETFPDPMPAYQYGICGFRIPPLIDVIGPGNVLVNYTVTYGSCTTVALSGSWQMWRCVCGCSSVSTDYYVPPGSCFNYCGDGVNLCACGGWPSGGMGGQSLPTVAPSFDCETGEVFWDIPFHIGTCFAGSPAYSTTHHPLGGYGIYSFS